LLAKNEELRCVRKPWAWLVRHVFVEDVSRCPKCSGPMRWLEVASSPDAIANLLARHGLRTPDLFIVCLIEHSCAFSCYLRCPSAGMRFRQAE